MFKNPEARRFSLVFAIVYSAQGMFHLPDLSVTFLLKNTFGLGAAQTAAFLSITMIPWLIKPLYGLISDFIPLFGCKRKSYFLVTSGLAAIAGFSLSIMGSYTYGSIAALLTLMGLGIAFMDVLVDGMMVENGKRFGLTREFQSIQWAAISMASVVVGVSGGWLAQNQALSVTFFITALFPLIAFMMAIVLVREPHVQAGERPFGETWAVIRGVIGSRTLWTVAAFIFFFNFSPSFGPALAYYSTDVLQFSKVFIGTLDSVSSASGMVGAALYFAFSKSVPFNRLLHFAVAAGVTATLAYLGYRSETSALVLALVFGGVTMIIQLIFLDLAATACPKQVEGTFFALLMSVFNVGGQISQITGGWLYEQTGFTVLIFVSAGFTAFCWLLIPLLNFEESESRSVISDPTELTCLSVCGAQRPLSDGAPRPLLVDAHA